MNCMRNCPVCKTTLGGKDVTNNNYAECTLCELPYHRECYDLTKKCSAYGCAGDAVRLAPKQTLSTLVEKEKEVVAVGIVSGGLEQALQKYEQLEQDVPVLSHAIRQHVALEDVYSNADEYKKEIFGACLKEVSNRKFYYEEILTLLGMVGMCPLGAMLGGFLGKYFFGEPMLFLPGAIIGSITGGSGGYFFGGWLDKNDKTRAEDIKKITAKYENLIERTHGQSKLLLNGTHSDKR